MAMKTLVLLSVALYVLVAEVESLSLEEKLELARANFDLPSFPQPKSLEEFPMFSRPNVQRAMEDFRSFALSPRSEITGSLYRPVMLAGSNTVDGGNQPLYWTDRKDFVFGDFEIVGTQKLDAYDICKMDKFEALTEEGPGIYLVEVVFTIVDCGGNTDPDAEFLPGNDFGLSAIIAGIGYPVGEGENLVLPFSNAQVIDSGIAFYADNETLVIVPMTVNLTAQGDEIVSAIGGTTEILNSGCNVVEVFIILENPEEVTETATTDITFVPTDEGTADTESTVTSSEATKTSSQATETASEATETSSEASGTASEASGTSQDSQVTTSESVSKTGESSETTSETTSDNTKDISGAVELVSSTLMMAFAVLVQFA